MTPTHILLGALALLFVVLSVSAIRSAYYNGVNDGFGAAVDPTNPGYRKARAYLVKYRAYHWQELDVPVEDTQPNNDASTRPIDARLSNMCVECYGRGSYDDPPWGIVRCSTCKGRGSIKV